MAPILGLDDPHFTVDKQCLWVGNLGGAESSIWLKVLMHPRNDVWPIVIGHELRSGSWPEAIFRTFPVGHRQIHLN